MTVGHVVSNTEPCLPVVAMEKEKRKRSSSKTFMQSASIIHFPAVAVIASFDISNIAPFSFLFFGKPKISVAQTRANGDK